MVFPHGQLIYRQQAASSGKPPAVVEKIVAGRMEKFYQEFCLMEQPFVRDPNMIVKDVIHNVTEKLGGTEIEGPILAEGDSRPFAAHR